MNKMTFPVAGELGRPFRGYPHIHLLSNGNYRYITDLLFDWLGFQQKNNLLLIQHMQSILIQTNEKGGQLYNDTAPNQ